LNRHSFGNSVLSAARLPVPPRPHFVTYSVVGGLGQRKYILSSSRLSCDLLRFRPPDVDRCRVKSVLDMCGIMLLNHRNARAAVLGYLINVGAFGQAKANIGVAKAVSTATIAVAVRPKFEFVEDGSEQFTVAFGKEPI
jgi:hypothetical protein